MKEWVGEWMNDWMNEWKTLQKMLQKNKNVRGSTLKSASLIYFPDVDLKYFFFYSHQSLVWLTSFSGLWNNWWSQWKFLDSFSWVFSASSYSTEKLVGLWRYKLGKISSPSSPRPQTKFTTPSTKLTMVKSASLKLIINTGNRIFSSHMILVGMTSKYI